MEFSERIQEIKAELKKRGWKYADLAKNSGIPLSTILKVLSGNTRSPRVDTVEAIERALGINEKSPAENGEAKSDLNIPEKYKDILIALNNGSENLEQDDIDDITRFIEFTANRKNKK